MEILEKKNSHTIYLSSHLKNPEKDEQNKSKASRKKEIMTQVLASSSKARKTDENTKKDLRELISDLSKTLRG